MSEKPIITVKNLVKNYGDFKAVKGISFEVYEGEIFGLLGPNGAGKTTTLEIIETLRDKTSGEITVDGFDIETGADSIKQVIGVQLQAAGYYPNLNLSELINLFSGLYGINKTPMEMLEKVALTDKAKAKYKDLSGGQKQRVAIARALINDPIIIMGDEPTGNLDKKNSEIVFTLFKELAEVYHQTLLIVTHDNSFAERTGRILEMEDGRMISQT